MDTALARPAPVEQTQLGRDRTGEGECLETHLEWGVAHAWAGERRAVAGAP